MFNFEKEQKRFSIGNTEIGGEPWRYPTVLIGTIFYKGDKTVEDEKSGKFDKEKAEEVIKLQEEFSDKTGNPCMIDVVVSTEENMRKHLDFVSSVTDMPILMDGVISSVKISGLDYIKEAGIKDVVYNSITIDSGQDELKSIKESGIESVLLLAMNMKDFTSKGRVDAAKQLVNTVQEIGVTKPIIDTAILDLPSLGAGCNAIYQLKTEVGLPCGSGAHNAVDTWRGLKSKMGKQAKKPALAVANAVTIATGADFILYGPIKHADFIFPAVAMVDVAFSSMVTESGIRLDRSHPRYKIA